MPLKAIRHPDWRRPENMHANLLVTFGWRAGEMQALGYISLPHGLDGEDQVAAAGIEAVRLWETGSRPEDAYFENFDEHIEDYLLKHFPKED